MFWFDIWCALGPKRLKITAIAYTVGETGEQPNTFKFSLNEKIYIHILQQIFLIQKEDTCLCYDYRPLVLF